MSEDSPRESGCIIIGLGNIGEQYAGSRHNIGFDVLDEIVADGFIAEPPHPLVRTARHKTNRGIILAWPQTYMNLSGHAARHLLERERLTSEHLLIVVDDFALPLGSLRFRPGGTDGGHNGLASIIEMLGTESFPRLRLGVGLLPERADTVEFVLSPFSSNELETKKMMVRTAAEAVIFAAHHGVEDAMAKYNRIHNPA